MVIVADPHRRLEAIGWYWLTETNMPWEHRAPATIPIMHTAYLFWHTFCRLLLCIHKVIIDVIAIGGAHHWYWIASIIFLRFYPFWSILVILDFNFTNTPTMPPMRLAPTSTWSRCPLALLNDQRGLDNETGNNVTYIVTHIFFIVAECNSKPVIGFQRFCTSLVADWLRLHPRFFRAFWHWNWHHPMLTAVWQLESSSFPDDVGSLQTAS